MDLKKLNLNKLLNPVEKSDLDSFYENVMETSRVVESTGEEPLYVRAARVRAIEMGISPDRLLANYSERLRTSTYPTSSCLTPEEVQACTSDGVLSDERQRHISTCEQCNELLKATQPPSEVFAQLMEQMGEKAAQKTMTAGALFSRGPFR